MNNEVKKATEVLKSGGIILYPTDTVWAIGCDATNEEAVRKIYSLKQRASTNKVMLVLMENQNQLTSYVEDVPEVAWELIEVSDKPLTIIYSGAKNLAPNLVSDDGSIGIRITCDRFCEALIRAFRKPIVSTSANISGEKTAITFPEISEEILNGVDYIVDWRRDEQSPAEPSSIIKLGSGGEINIIRK